jgi:hypothetical protein
MTLFGVTMPLDAAELVLADLFAEHAVLQREVSVPVWGWANAGEEVVVEFAGQSRSAKANASGAWRVEIGPLGASSEPRVLLVQSKTRNLQRKIGGVVVGEVWFASGQSNMQWGFSPSMQVLRNEVELNAALDSLVRQFTVKKQQAAEPLLRTGGSWHVCTRENLLKNGENGDSALAYFFARELRRALAVPVGVINASLGGMAIEAWTSDSAQRQVPELKTMLESREVMRLAFEREMEAYNTMLEVWKVATRQSEGGGTRAPPAPKRPVDPLRFITPARCFNGMVAQVIPYGIRGVIWYQGETNANSIEGGSLYRIQLPVLIADWRARWHCELPFAWVQLPNVNRGPGWMLVREAMLKSLAVPRTGMAVTIDIGEATNVHPKNKQEVARRLALWALGEVYGQKVAATCGPRPIAHAVRGAEIAICFKHTDGGLEASTGDSLRGFIVAAMDRRWRPASARIEGEKVIVSSTEVKEPVAVRYAWEPNPDGNLVNGAGLPASPFRTDDWPIAINGRDGA